MSQYVCSDNLTLREPVPADTRHILSGKYPCKRVGNPCRRGYGWYLGYPQEYPCHCLAVLVCDGSEGVVCLALGFVLDEDEEKDLQQQRLQQPQEQPLLEQQPDLDDGCSPSPSV
jgi:hypothetical protein